MLQTPRRDVLCPFGPLDASRLASFFLGGQCHLRRAAKRPAFYGGVGDSLRIKYTTGREC
jgi:hypothetical protein